MQDLKFLTICILVSSILIAINKPLFIKSFGSSKLANYEIKQTAQKIKLEGFSKIESDFWDNIKDIDSKPILTPKYSTYSAKSKTNEDKKNLAQISNYPQQQKRVESNRESLISLSIKQKEPSKRFLLVGDSIMSFLGVAFKNNIKKTEYDLDAIKVSYKISTGLNRIDFYNWYSRTRQLIQQNNPDAMVVVFGGNDDQHILDKSKKLRAELTPEWEKAYEERVERYAKLLDEYSVKKVYWIGHPMSNVARYNKFFPIFNRIYKKVAQGHPKIEFVDYWNTFAASGKFVPVAADSNGRRGRVRYNDGLHPTEHGAKIMVEILRNKMIEQGVLQMRRKKDEG
ncbi:MAG: DUF459 domain-containing protein [Mastigocoleus sp.]